MIYEGHKPNFEDVILTAETPKRLICKHDFWEQLKLLDFGDIILCQRCNQYFTKVKHMPRVIRSKIVENVQSITGQKLKIKVKSKSDHLLNIQCMVRVPVRILNPDDKK